MSSWRQAVQLTKKKKSMLFQKPSFLKIKTETLLAAVLLIATKLGYNKNPISFILP
jgi:hypothetical protein